jgi:hypothetical protein
MVFGGGGGGPLPNFDKFKQFASASWLKNGILSQKLLSRKYFSKKMVVTVCFVHFSYDGFFLSKLAFKNAF